MGAKKKGGKKSKTPAVQIDKNPAAVWSMGFQVNEEINTPLGMRAAVLGIVYTNAETQENPVLMVKVRHVLVQK